MSSQLATGGLEYNGGYPRARIRDTGVADFDKKIEYTS